MRTGRQLQFSARLDCLEDTAVVWSVQEPGGGTISANGLYTAPSALPPGATAHVVATSVANPSLVAVATVSLRQNAGTR